MNEYRFYINRLPEIAAHRADMAGMYRRLRKQNAGIARLLFVRTNAAYKLLKAAYIDRLYV